MSASPPGWTLTEMARESVERGEHFKALQTSPLAKVASVVEVFIVFLSETFNDPADRSLCTRLHQLSCFLPAQQVYLSGCCVNDCKMAFLPLSASKLSGAFDWCVSYG